MPVIGFLNGQSPKPFAHLLAAFHRGLNSTGYIEGQNVAIEYRWAEGRSEQMSVLADELVRRRVDVIVAAGGAHTVAKKATSTIPIVFTMGSDPVQAGFVASINRPGGNLTGAMVFSAELEAKRFEFVHELVPTAPLIGVLLDPSFSAAETQSEQVHVGARALGRRIRIVNASSDNEIDSAFATLVQEGAGVVLVTANPFLNSKRAQVAALALRHRMPTVFEYREGPVAGGLMSYGPSIPEVYRQIGVYAGRILKGEKAAELPVVQPTRFELVFNLKTAKAIGIDLPPTLVARADEVIE
jgi:putative ABC transport system substrate-binding protein